MKRFLIILPLIVILAAGCTTIEGIFGKNAEQFQKQTDKITQVSNEISDNEANKVSQVSSLSFGTDYALNKATNKEPAVVIAKELNNRVESLVGLPALEEQKAMVSLVEDLISNSIAGQKELAKKDGEIQAIQHEESLLVSAKTKAVNDAIAASQILALKTDSQAAQLEKYQGWFGLSAVFIGIKQFATTSFWFLLGGGAIFLVLRILSTTNPIASAIFGIFDTVFAWLINAIKVLAPKAFGLANTVSGDIYNETKSALSQIVDSVETVKLTSAASGKPATIEDLLDTAELSMSQADKALIDQIKIKMGWVKAATISTVPVSVTSPVATTAVTSVIVPVVAPTTIPTASPNINNPPVA